MNTLTDATISKVAGGSSEKARMLLAEMSVGLTKAQALAAPKLFQVKKAVGEKATLKLLAVIVNFILRITYNRKEKHGAH